MCSVAEVEASGATLCWPEVHSIKGMAQDEAFYARQLIAVNFVECSRIIRGFKTRVYLLFELGSW